MDKPTRFVVAFLAIATLGPMLLQVGREAAELYAVQASLSCEGEGEGQAQGGYDDANSGAGQFRYGAAWTHGTDEAEPSADGMLSLLDPLRHSVVLTDERGFAEAMRASADPERDVWILGDLFNANRIRVEYDADGKAVAYQLDTAHRGSSTVPPDAPNFGKGRLAIDEAGCVRGGFRFDFRREAQFALPLWRSDAAAWFAQSPEAGVEDGHAAEPPRPAPQPDDALAQWAQVHAQLMLENPAHALLALGLTPSAATVAAEFPQVRATLERLRTQCPDPARSRPEPQFHAFGEIVGVASPAPEIELAGTVRTQAVDGAAVLQQCYVTGRNGQPVEQCWPMQSDCRTAKVWER